jgi:hypothetical protein
LKLKENKTTNTGSEGRKEGRSRNELKTTKETY